jgi:hypothetical protein
VALSLLQQADVEAHSHARRVLAVCDERENDTVSAGINPDMPW